MLRTTAAAAVLSLAPCALGAIVYGNLATPLGTSHELVAAGATGSPEIGNQIIVASQAVSELDVALHIGGEGEAQFDLRARIYGTSETWDSQPLHVSIAPGADAIYAFAVPKVQVEQSIWTVEITNRTGNQAAISLPEYGPAAYGNATLGYWTHGPSGWTFTEGEPDFGAAMIGPGQCCSNDFNHDGDIATDNDIEDFFRCIGGNCCPLCDSPDFNCDGDVGTDEDIMAFFAVLAGGSCS